MPLPRITVVTPSFNQGQFLEQTILSVLGQNYPDLEYIIIDGGSTDNSVEIISKYADSLTHWESKPDRGQAHAINKGFGRATGEIMCWINSDDFFFPHVFHRLVSFFESDKAELFYGGCLQFNAERKWSVIRQPSEPFDRELYRVLAFFDQASTFWTRRLWEAAGTLDETMHYGFDWEWFNRAADHGQFKVLPFIISAYRFHASHKTSGGNLENRRREIREIVGRYANQDSMDVYEAVGKAVAPHVLRRCLSTLWQHCRRAGY